jgi:hypothetical protein
MATIIVFASALFVISAFIFIKAVELKYGKKNIILALIGKFDSKCDHCVSGFKFKSLQLIQSIRYIILVQSKIIFKNLLDRVMKKIIDEYKFRQKTIMGHKNITGNGSASFYLKKITEHKGNGEKGKIE